MWIYTTNNEMINLGKADRIEVRQEMDEVAGESVEPNPKGNMTGVSIVAHFDNTEAQLAFVAAAPNYDVVVTRYWTAIRTAMKSGAQICDLMDIA